MNKEMADGSHGNPGSMMKSSGMMHICNKSVRIFVTTPKIGIQTIKTRKTLNHENPKNSHHSNNPLLRNNLLFPPFCPAHKFCKEIYSIGFVNDFMCGVWGD